MWNNFGFWNFSFFFAKKIYIYFFNAIFRQPEPFDWYQVYGGIKDVISQFINKNDKILNIGAGNSSNSFLKFLK